MLSLDSKNRILDEVAYMAATGNLFFVTEDEEAETQQRSEDFILGDYTVTSLLEYRSLQQMGVDIFFDILPGLTRTFSPRKRAKNCKKGIACGNTCIAKNRVCKQNLSPAVAAQVPPAKAKTKKAAGGATTAPAAPAAPSAPAPAPAPAPASAAASPQKTTTKKPKASPAPAQSNAVSSATVTTNQAELDKKRNNLTKRFGKQLVEKAETNVKRILDDPDNDIYVRVSSADTLEKILGNRFLTSAELNVTQHKIPFLSDDYQTARNRVEQKVLGVDLSTDPANRPIYGYMGSSDLNGNSHNSGVQDYGSIVVKLKPETKNRATFTGSDSFKSGIASEVVSADNPPPPNAASLVSTTRHGYDKDSLPSGYPAFYKSKAGEKDQLTKAADAKNIDDLVNHLSPTGAKYIETQIHGGVKPSDIAELRFESNKAKPTPAIGQLAKANGIDLIVDGKKLSSKQLDKLIGGNVTPTAKTGYKPKMSRAEADAYTKDSVYANRVFYHGTSAAAAKSITTDGVDPLRTSTSFYGKGFYTSSDKSIARLYSTGAIVGMKLDVKKPLVVYDQADLKRRMAAMGVNDVKRQGNQTNKVATKMREALLKNGYDAIEVQAHSYFVPLKQESVAVFEVKAK